MQPQRKHPRNSIVSNAVTRGRLHNNIIEWRAQAGARALHPVPTPSPVRPLFIARVENIVLGIIAVITLVIAHKTGVLALIVDMVGAL